MSRILLVFSAALLLLMPACNGNGMESRDTGPDDMGVDVEDDTNDGPTDFSLTIENTSDRSNPTPYSPPVWAISDGSVTFPETGTEATEALEQLAEDGQADPLVNALTATSGIADAGRASGGVAPGSSTTLNFSAESTEARLHVATMFVQSNDIVLGTPPEGIALFDEQGDPVSSETLAEQMVLVDAGTERDQAPYYGPEQAPRQASMNSGAAEGVVAPFQDATRAMPLPSGFLDLEVTEESGTFTFTVTNASDTNAQFTTPIGPIYWAVHDDTFTVFEEGSSASSGLELLAEDGPPSGLINEHSAATGVLDQGAVAVTNERPGADPGAALPGESFTFEVSPDADNPYLSTASMTVQSNDVFWAPRNPIRLLDDNGDPRPTSDIEADMTARLVHLDAGTEANEVPGIGPNTKTRQGDGTDIGPEDPEDTVRLYRDATNDLAELDSNLNVTVAAGGAAGEYEITISNVGGDTAYPFVITPVTYATHADSVQLFEGGESASTGVAGLESVAEDGDPSTLVSTLNGLGSGIGTAGVQNTPDGAGSPGPAGPGASYTFTVTADSTNRHLSFVSMVVPSNDTFIALSPEGVDLYDSSDNPRSAEDIETDLNAELAAWDAGTEANQAGAAGADQANPLFDGLGQSGPDQGATEGDGTITPVADTDWTYPTLNSILSVTLSTEQ